jgi:hypothetical protein
MLTAVIRRVSEGLLRKATFTRVPMYAAGLEAFDLVPTQN